jgi:hypothetical protein
MKQVILGAALCGAGLALAAAANAADDNYDFLYGSTDALVLGPTGVAVPSTNYITSGLNLYLEPLGYQGTLETTLPLTTINSWDFYESVPQGEKILVDSILADYNAGEMDCDATGVCSDPLTIFTYSQSSLVAALAQEQLSEDGVPSDALRFVMLGANPSAVPTDLYPTEIFNIHGDAYAEPGSLGTSWQDLMLGLQLHEAYLGLTAAQIDSATTVVDGMTTINEIPTLTTAELWEALLSAFSAS